MDNRLSFLGLMYRAGSLAIGADKSYDAARRGKIKLLMLASDAAKNTVSGAKNALREKDVPLVTLPYTKAELGDALGKGECSALAILDFGFAISFCERMGFAPESETLRRKSGISAKSKADRGNNE
ncbi:MAG: ribosomal L7Ae/L30e/S12e/Gadd45 family protein [Clostridia bacterium]|nr:ribosomal L7Ae/L30e/S12e/Gadd45 family protein [Clostridia bacterium]